MKKIKFINVHFWTYNLVSKEVRTMDPEQTSDCGLPRSVCLAFSHLFSELELLLKRKSKMPQLSSQKY